MPQKFKQEDGTEIDVFTQAELDEQANARAEQAKTDAEAAKQEELDRLAQDKAEVEEKLEKELAKEKNFKALRDSKGGVVPEELTKQIEDINKKIEGITQAPINEVKDSFKKSNYGDNKDLNSKFDYYFDKLKGEAKTRDDILKAATEAHTLVSGGQKPNLDFQMYGTRVSQDYRQNKDDTEQTSERKRAMAAEMGLSEADLKKYGPKKK